MSDEYRALVEKVDAFTRAAVERRRVDMACQAGCCRCCEVWLSVSAVEAAQLGAGLASLPAEARARIAQRGAREQAREAAGASDARCAMLEDDGRCAVYESRPLVCRTQGHALRYPAGFVPDAAVRARATTGDITYCPLNFTNAPPAAQDVLDAERVDQLLAVVGQRFTQARGQAPEARVAISALAAHADDPPPAPKR